MALKGCTEQRLTELRAQGESYEHISRLLAIETRGKVSVTGNTIRNWCVALGINGAVTEEGKKAG